MTTAVATPSAAANPQAEVAAPATPTTPVVEAKVKEEAGKPAETKPEAAKEEAAPASSQVPEKYEFKAGNGESFDAEQAADFSAFAKQNGLSQEAAQSALAAAEKLVASHQAKTYESAVERWASEARADKEIGGDKLTENLALAKRGIEAFATPGLQKLLKHPSEGGIGWGNQRDVIATFALIGKRLSPDGFVAGKQAAPVTKTPEQAFYDKSNMN